MSAPRPRGITFLVILAILLLILHLSIGYFMIPFSPYDTGVVSLFLLAALILVADGFWTAVKYSWMIAIGVDIVYGALAVLYWGFFGLPVVVVVLVILYYLTRPHVKAYFGLRRDSSAASWSVCSRCNSRNRQGQKFCGECGARLPVEDQTRLY